MKKTILLFAAALVATVSCSTKKTESSPEQTPAQQLISKLVSLQDSGRVAFGHHDDVAYGHYWEYTADSSDVKSATGQYPAIMDWDLGLIEYGSDVNLDSVPFAFMAEQVAAHHARGGINAFSWHPRNPLTGGNSWDTGNGDVVARIVTEGDSLNTIVTAWLDSVAGYLSQLKDREGNPLPVIFRPWHEHTGEWFWWGINQTTPESYVKLWHMTRDAFDRAGADNIVWAYSPDKSNVNNLDDYMRHYPGDEYVDIMGADVYHFNGAEGIETFNEWMHTTLGAAVEAARQHGKIVALTETGSEGLVLDNWYMDVLWPAVKDYPIAYITVWRNGHNMNRHFYVPYPGHPATADFVEFFNLPETVFADEIANF